MHVTMVGDLDDGHADMLLVLRAEPAIIRAASLPIRRETERLAGNPVKMERIHVSLGIIGHFDIDPAMIRAELFEPDAILSNYDSRLNQTKAGVADAFRDS